MTIHPIDSGGDQTAMNYTNNWSMSAERYAKALEVVEAARHVANANGRNTKWHPAICIERSGRFGEDETIKCVCGLDGMRTALAAFDESSE